MDPESRQVTVTRHRSEDADTDYPVGTLFLQGQLLDYTRCSSNPLAMVIPAVMLRGDCLQHMFVKRQLVSHIGRKGWGRAQLRLGHLIGALSL
jgi:hypothetical protein